MDLFLKVLFPFCLLPLGPILGNSFSYQAWLHEHILFQPAFLLYDCQFASHHHRFQAFINIQIFSVHLLFLHITLGTLLHIISSLPLGSYRDFLFQNFKVLNLCFNVLLGSALFSIFSLQALTKVSCFLHATSFYHLPFCSGNTTVKMNCYYLSSSLTPYRKHKLLIFSTECLYKM